MSCRKPFGGFVVFSFALLAGCSGSTSPIPSPSGEASDETNVAAPAVGTEETKKPARNRPLSNVDGGDAGVADASTDPDTGTAPVTCEACSANSCAAQHTACAEDATCPLLKTCLDECTTGSCKSACLAQYPDPIAKAKNGALYKCECVTSCSTECAVECG